MHGYYNPCERDLHEPLFPAKIPTYIDYDIYYVTGTREVKTLSITLDLCLKKYKL